MPRYTDMKGFTKAIKGQIFYGQYDPSRQKQKMNSLFWRSVYREFKTTYRIALASLKAEKKPFYYFWQLFFIPGVSVSEQKHKKFGYRDLCFVRISRPPTLFEYRDASVSEFGYRDHSVPLFLRGNTLGEIWTLITSIDGNNRMVSCLC